MFDIDTPPVVFPADLNPRNFTQADLQRISHVLRYVLNDLNMDREHFKWVAKGALGKESKEQWYNASAIASAKIVPLAALQARVKKLLQNPA